MPDVDLLKMFVALLKNSGWTEVMPFVEYRKDHWMVVFDTSSWMMVGTNKNSRIFDVPVPEVERAGWTLSLIEHLCKTEDELQELKGGRASGGAKPSKRGVLGFMRRPGE